MGGLWVDYERNAEGGIVVDSPRNHVTNIPGLYAIGECDYQYHGANRLGANSLLSCIFAGLVIGPGLQQLFQGRRPVAEEPSSEYDKAQRVGQQEFDQLLASRDDGENPYRLHQQLGDVMTKTATVVRYNDQLDEGYRSVCDLADRAQHCALSDTGNWTNQNVVFTRALRDMFPLAKTILKGARLRDECRGAHYKPDFDFPGIETDDPAERRRRAEKWCDEFAARNRQWLKTTIADWDAESGPDISYEPVDTSQIPPRPRLYGLVGAEAIEEVWNQRQRRAATRQQAEAS
jgi:succinate dehydrogenase / fumarate reductase flavoprotein subunit